MTRVATLAIGVLVLHAIACGGYGQSSDSAKDALGDDAEAKHQLNAKSNPTTPKEYKSLFKSLGSENVERLKQHQHTGIALRAAWLQLLIATTVPKRRKTVEPAETQRFLGFVEGRLGVGIPESWEAALLRAKPLASADAVSVGDEWICFSRGDELFYKQTESGCSAPSGVSLKKRPEEWSLGVGDSSIGIPASLVKELILNELRDEFGPNDDMKSLGVTALLSADDCYLAFHDVVCGRYKLVSLDPRTKQVRWKVDVEADVTGNVRGLDTYDYTGWFYHWVTLVEKNDVLFVFGVSWECAYIEAFNTKDETNLFRFSTGY